MKQLLSFLLIFIAALSVKAQFKSIEFRITGEKGIINAAYEKEYVTAKQLNQNINKVYNQLYASGYLNASAPSFDSTSEKIIVTVNAGSIFRWSHLRAGNLNPEDVKSIRFRERLYNGSPFRTSETGRLLNSLLIHAENNGYPFASVKLDSVEINNDRISASLKYEAGKFYSFDSVVIKGKSSLRKAFITHYLDFRKGTPYNENRLRQAERRLKSLPYVSVIKPPSVLFTNTSAIVFIYADEKKASTFDGVLGVLPDAKQEGKIALSGELHMRLINAFDAGELAAIDWRKLPGASQDLKINLLFPYLFSLPFGLDAGLSIYKNDTVYITVQQRFGIQYLFGPGNYIKTYFNPKKSSLLSTKGLENITVLPDYADISAALYGIEFFVDWTDVKTVPRQGGRIKTSLATGNRTIIKNARINPDVYEGLTLHSATYSLEGEAAVFLPLARQWIIMLAGQSGWIINDQLFANELFRIGGLKTLRGFDEESIHASAFCTGTAEIRFLFEEQSFFSLFADQAYVESRLYGKPLVHDTPLGFGAGVSFETKAGIFSFQYALGRQLGNPLSLRSGKIHFGIVAAF